MISNKITLLITKKTPTYSLANIARLNNTPLILLAKTIKTTDTPLYTVTAAQFHHKAFCPQY